MLEQRAAATCSLHWGAPSLVSPPPPPLWRLSLHCFFHVWRNKTWSSDLVVFRIHRMDVSRVSACSLRYSSSSSSPAGLQWRLHLYQQRSRPRQPWSSGQDGEFLLRRDIEVPVPSVLWRHGAAQLGQVHLQHRGPPSAYLAPSSKMTSLTAAVDMKDSPGQIFCQSWSLP